MTVYKKTAEAGRNITAVSTRSKGKQTIEHLSLLVVVSVRARSCNCRASRRVENFAHMLLGDANLGTKDTYYWFKMHVPVPDSV